MQDEGFCKFKKNYLFSRYLFFFIWKIRHACAARGKSCRFFGIELIKIKPINSNVTVFKNWKKWKSLHPYIYEEFILSSEPRFLKNLAWGQEGGPAKLAGAYCGIFKDRYSPQTKVIFSLGPYPISFQGGPRNEIKNQVKNQVTVKIAFDI